MHEDSFTEFLDLNALSGFEEEFCLRWPRSHMLGQGENAHQKAAAYGAVNDYFSLRAGPFPGFTHIQDLVAGMFLMGEFEKAAIAAFKHAHLVGASVAMSLEEGWAKWPAASMESRAVGVLNRTVDGALLEQLFEAGVQVFLAPGYTADAMEIASRHTQVTLLEMTELLRTESLQDIRILPFGALVQDRERFSVNMSSFRLEPGVPILPNILDDALFAWRCAKHARSCALVVARAETIVSLSTGQLSSSDAWLVACERAKRLGVDFNEAVLAIDTHGLNSSLLENAAASGLCAVVAPVVDSRESDELRDLASVLGLCLIETQKAHLKL